MTDLMRKILTLLTKVFRKGDDQNTSQDQETIKDSPVNNPVIETPDRVWHPSYLVTSRQIQDFVGIADNDLVDSINETLERFDIAANPRRVRYFMAQCAYETSMFKKLTEDLTYTTAKRIATVWPTRFHDPDTNTGKGPLDARLYVRNPQKLANEVYANRYGNRGPGSGDGYRFRGRGPFHLTFAANYEDASKYLFGDYSLYANPDLVADFKYGFLTAGWFWTTRTCNDLADADQFTEVTKRINGASGANLERVVQERLPMLRKANQAFKW